MNAPAQQATDAPPKLPTITAGGAVRAIVPNDFESAWRIANAVVKSGMAPRGVDTAEKAMVAIMHGLEVGMAPMMALQSIAPINGRPAIYGDGALGLVQGSGLMEWHKEYYRGEPETDGFTAVCEVKRKGDPEVKTGEFSIKDAKDAQLFGKEGPWRTYRKRMLKMRARGFALRDGFSDVLRGLHIAEEVQDIPMRDVTPRDDGPPAPPPAARAALPAPQPQADPVAMVEAGRDNGQQVEWTDADGPAPTDNHNETQWLNDLDGALSGCEDVVTLGQKQAEVMAPMKAKVSPDAWRKAEKIMRDHFQRINATMLDAG